MTRTLSPRQHRMLHAVARRGTVLLIDKELLVPFGVITLRSLQRRGLLEKAADGWTVGVTSAGRRWLREQEGR